MKTKSPPHQNPLQYVLFVGNPGVGKSTLLNSVIQNIPNIGQIHEKFKSGVSICSGLTYSFDEVHANNQIFMDTPGLVDLEKWKAAAAAIDKALKRDGEFKLVFVIKLEAGRLNPDDVALVSIILDAAPDIHRYGLIINNCSNPIQKRLADPDELLKIITKLDPKGSRKSELVTPIVLKHFNDLFDVDDAYLKIPELNKFINELDYSVIRERNVTIINKLRNDNEILPEAMVAMRSRYEDSLSTLHASIRVPSYPTGRSTLNNIEFSKMERMNLSSKSIDQLTELAKISESAERYNDMSIIMCELVKQATQNSKGLADEQRNLLAVSFRNIVGASRNAWRETRSLYLIDSKEDATLLEEYIIVIENELKEKCNSILEMLTESLILKESDPNYSSKESSEPQVFYLRMKGDYYRYLAEIEKSNKEILDKSNYCYSEAKNICEANLPATHPIRLGLAVNYSIFYYELMNDSYKACNLAKSAFDSAISESNELTEENYKDSTLMMQVLRDNWTLWTSENEQEEN